MHHDVQLPIRPLHQRDTMAGAEKEIPIPSGTDSVGVVAGGNEELGRGVESDTEPFEHLRGDRLGEDLQVTAVDR